MRCHGPPPGDEEVEWVVRSGEVEGSLVMDL